MRKEINGRQIGSMTIFLDLFSRFPSLLLVVTINMQKEKAHCIMPCTISTKYQQHSLPSSSCFAHQHQCSWLIFTKEYLGTSQTKQKIFPDLSIMGVEKRGVLGIHVFPHGKCQKLPCSYLLFWHVFFCQQTIKI